MGKTKITKEEQKIIRANRDADMAAGRVIQGRERSAQTVRGKTRRQEVAHSPPRNSPQSLDLAETGGCPLPPCQARAS